ncbi:MAG: ABC transporter permease [Blastocatellia bacterium]|nr:ABC transporter permease [Blastocatellia bacterium]
MQTLIRDLRNGARMLLKHPGFTSIAVITLALGIGLNSALFSVVNALILRPLPYRDPARLVQLWQDDRNTGNAETPVSNADFLAWRAQARSFTYLTAHNLRPATLSTGDGTIEVPGVFVAGNFFTTLGVTPRLGRSFTTEEEQIIQSSVVIVSHSFWQSHLGGRADVIGQTITLDEQPQTIVGVLPPSYRHPEVFSDREAEIFLPLPLRADDHRHALRVIGRLQHGYTPEQAQAEISSIAGQLEGVYPLSNRGFGANLVPLAQQHSSKVRRSLLLLQGAVGFVLLIACVNLANLLLARVATREKELAIRAALGAGKLRLIRLFLSESLWLTALGGLGGLLLALWFVDLLPALEPHEITNLGDVRIDGTVLGFAFLLSLLAMFLFSLAPLWHASRTNINDVLKESPSAPRGKGLRSLLVVAEVALTVILLAGAGLMLRSLLLLQNVPLGFAAENLLMMHVSLPESIPSTESAFRKLSANVGSLPGVQSVGLTSCPPLSTYLNFHTDFVVNGLPEPAQPKNEVGLRFISPNYFQTMGIPLAAGRDFTDADNSTAPRVAMVNQAFERIYLQGLSRLGRKLQLRGSLKDIVGVVSDFKNVSLQTEVEPEIYIPQAQDGFGGMWLMVRTRVKPAGLAGEVQRAVWQVEKKAVLTRQTTMNDQLVDLNARPRFILLMLSVFASVALLLSGVGVYGVLSYTVAQSTREIGIRMAIGADARDMMKLVIGQGMFLALFGVCLGLAGAFALTRSLKAMLYGVSPTDPLTFVTIALLLMIIALLACWVPARRATKVDPITALRSE